MKGDEIRRAIRRKELEEALRQEFEATLSDRVDRYLRVHVPGIIPYKHFALPFEESEKLYRDGHYYGCIALTQAVAEAVVRHIWEVNQRSRRRKKFKAMVAKLHRRGLITRKVKKCLLKIWEGRNDYHHLNPTIGPDTGRPDEEMDEELARHRAKLERLARVKTRLLNKVVAEAFRWSIDAGRLVVEKPKYWKKK
jgi:hypothetical protein